MAWDGWVQGAARRGDALWRSLRRRPAERVFADERPVELLPFRSHAYGGRLRVQGRVVLDRRLLPTEQLGETSQRMAAMVRRFLTSEVVGARIEARWQGPGPREVRVEGRTDEGGYFDLDLGVDVPPGAVRRWEAVQLRLVDRSSVDDSPDGVARVQVSAAGTGIGLISDIDDTVVVTRADRKLRHVRTVLGHDAATRAMLPGAVELYRALEQRHDLPIWYLSSAAWNLHDFFEELFDRSGLPAGAMELRELGAAAVGRDRHRNHKFARLEAIFRQTDHPMLLLGDAGQADAKIYAEAVQAHPQRVAGVLIRDVPDPKRSQRADAFLEPAAQATGVPMRRCSDSKDMARTLVEWGWLDSGEVPTSLR